MHLPTFVGRIWLWRVLQPLNSGSIGKTGTTGELDRTIGEAPGSPADLHWHGVGAELSHSEPTVSPTSQGASLSKLFTGGELFTLAALREALRFLGSPGVAQSVARGRPLSKLFNGEWRTARVNPQSPRLK